VAKKIRALLAGLLILLSIALLPLFATWSSPANQTRSENAPKLNTTPTTPLPESSRLTPSHSLKPVSQAALEWPKRAIIFEQTKINPHETAPAFYEFSRQLSHRFHGLQKEPTGLIDFKKDLEHCVEQKETVALETLCALYLKRVTGAKIKFTLSKRSSLMVKLLERRS
jgi:hypothetical protein